MSFFERSVAASTSICLTIVLVAACEQSPEDVGSDAGESTGGAAAGGTSGNATGGLTNGSIGGAGPGSGGHGGGGSGGTASGAPLFLAQGHLGRTMVSCDRGATWVANGTVRPTFEGYPPGVAHPTSEIRCFEENAVRSSPDPLQKNFDCDHAGSPGRGLAFGAGSFFATFGWGEKDGVYATNDGATLTKVLDDTTFGGLAYVQGHLVAGGHLARHSADGGATWSEDVETGLAGCCVRRVGQTAGHGGRVILVGEAGDAVISDDGGASWRKPSVFPAGCGKEIQGNGGIADAGGVWLVVGGDGSVCRSTDGGETFSYSTLGEGVSSHLTHDGTRFVAYGGGSRFASVDGENWTIEPVTPAGLSLGPIESDGDGRIVGVKGGWMQWYENQKFYFSDDGLNFTEASAPGSHPIGDLAFGRGTLPEVCR